MSRWPLTDPERFLAKVEQTAGCWYWRPPVIANGYGKFWLDGRKVPAHRAAYILFVGPIQDGYQIDHKCHTADQECAGGVTCPHRRCVNPDHLEPVTPRENALRSNGFARLNAAKTHCAKGHPYDEANTAFRRPRERTCRKCHRASVSLNRRSKQKKHLNASTEGSK